MHKASFWHRVWILAWTDFRLRYQGSLLGFLWALLKPLALFAVLLFVFSHFFAADSPDYPLQLLTALLMWMYFAEATMMGLTSLQAKAQVLKTIPVPGLAVLFASFVQATLTFFLHLLFLGVVVVIWQMPVGVYQILGFFFCVLIEMLLILFLSVVLAPLFLRFRDLHQIWEVLLLLGFYATPILYPLSALPNEVQSWIQLNPMTLVVTEAQSMLFHSAFMELPQVLIFFLFLVIAFLLSVWMFQRSQSRSLELL